MCSEGRGRCPIRPARALPLLAVLILIGSWVGCSPQAKYRVLSTFFDGVPNPDAKPTIAATASQGKAAVSNQPTSSIHKPYAEQRCDACHVGGAEQALAFQSTASLQDSNLCMKCHEKIPNSHAFMHAPVAARACLFCHSPHESPLPHLLSAAQPQLCTQCHEPAMLGKSTPEHQDPNSNCLTCHIGHGSETSRYFLRVAQPSTRPAPQTQPSASPSHAGLTPPRGQISLPASPGGDVAKVLASSPRNSPAPQSQPAVSAENAAPADYTQNDAALQLEHPLLLSSNAPESLGEPEVIGGPRQTQPFHLDPIQTAVEGRYRYEHDTSSPQGAPGQSFIENRFEEDLYLSTAAYIVHPNFVDMKLAGMFGLRQDTIVNNGQSQYSPEQVYDWDLSAVFFRKEDVPITLYSRQNSDVVSRLFAASFDTTITTSGAIVEWRNTPVPIRFEAYHSDQDQTAINQSESFTLSQNVATIHTDFVPLEHQRVNINYTFDNVYETSRSSGVPGTQVNAFNTNDFNANHIIEFGPNLQSNLDSALAYFDQSGNNPYQRLRFDERLLLKHSDTLETRYRYNLDYQSSNFNGSGPLEQLQNTFDASFTHRLYKSLITTGTAGVRYLDRSDGSNTFEYFAGINFDYHKLVPLGTLSATAGYAFDQQNNSAQTAETSVINQPHTFMDPSPIILVGTNIIASSIVVSNSNGLIVYTLNADYTVQVLSDQVQISRVVGGRIANGQTVLISYNLAPLPANVTTNNLVSTSLRYDFLHGPLRGLGVYGRYSVLDQNIESSMPSAFVPNSFHDTVVGAEYRFWELTLGGEQQWHHSTVAPYDASRFFVRFQYRLDPDTIFLFNPSYTIYDYLQQNDRSEELNTAASVTHRFTQSLTGSASISYLNLHDALAATTNGLDAHVELRWSFRQTSAFLQLRQSFLNTSSQDNTYQTVYVGFRRDF
jgi:predicted CXXCH cytochrome family protein